MHDLNHLGQMILKHWQTHHPKMLTELIGSRSRD